MPSFYLSSVNIFDSSGNRTTGTELSVARINLTSFVNNSKGYVCGGYGDYNSASGGYYKFTVDIYDIFGNRTTGTSLSQARHKLTSFANGGKGYVCGGYGNTGEMYNSTVDIYYDEEDIPTYSSDVPITEGTSYTLNGTSGIAETSEVLHFDNKVTGTVKYKDGDLYPSLDITVYDEDGTVATGADVVIEDLTCIATLILRDEDGTVLTGIDMNIEKVE